MLSLVLGKNILHLEKGGRIYLQEPISFYEYLFQRNHILYREEADIPSITLLEFHVLHIQGFLPHAAYFYHSEKVNENHPK